MINNLFQLAICSIIVFLCLGCAAAKRPILAPNDHLQEMAPEAVQHDIDECIRLANEAGPGAAKGKQIARQTAGGAAIGAAAGAVSGAITGGPGIGAAAGAVGGATWSFLGGLFRSKNMDDRKKLYIEDCLRQKGYNPIGWQ